MFYLRRESADEELESMFDDEALDREISSSFKDNPFDILNVDSQSDLAGAVPPGRGM